MVLNRKRSVDAEDPDAATNYAPYVFGVLLGCIAYGLNEKLVEAFAWHSSPIDWCEGNFTHSSYVAEFWNTLSALIMAAPAVGGYIWFNDEPFTTLEPKFWIIWYASFTVCIGTGLFHATLSVAGQVLDELPIVVLLFYAMVLMIPRCKWNARLRSAILHRDTVMCFTATLGLTCLLYPVFSHVVTLLTLPITTIMVILEFRVSHQKPYGLLYKTLFCLVVAVVSWLLDQLACQQLHDLGVRIPLHTFWHIGMAAVMWIAINLGLVIRLSGEKEQFKVTNKFGIIPVVEMLR